MSRASDLQSIYSALADVDCVSSALFKVGGAGAGDACSVILQRSVDAFVDFGSVQALENKVQITVQSAQVVPRPRRGDTFTVGSEVFTVERVESRSAGLLWSCLCQA